MSIDINSLNLDQCIRGCVVKFGFKSGTPPFSWEEAASYDSEYLRWLIFPYGEPPNWPDGPFTVLAGTYTQSQFVSECLSRAALEPEDETDLEALKRCLAA